MDAAEFERVGLYDPGAPNAPDRLRLLGWLVERGATLDQLVQADREGVLLYVGGTLALRPGPHVTMRQVADRIGTPLAQVDAFRLAFGLPPIAPDQPTFTEAEARLFGRFMDGIPLFGEHAMRRMARVIGSSTARIAEAMVAMNREHQLTPLINAGSSELAIAQANLRAIENAGAPAALVQGLLPVHLQLAGTRLRRGRRTQSAATVGACVGFVDLVGFTTVSHRLSTGDLADVVERFEDVAHDVATVRNGRVVKFIGDEVMFVTGDAMAACDIALALVEQFAGDPNVTPRGGIAAGELLDRGGDYYGPVVNLAARLAELAVPSEVLVSQAVADDMTSADVRCEPAGRRLLRGFAQPVSVLSVHRAT